MRSVVEGFFAAIANLFSNSTGVATADGTSGPALTSFGWPERPHKPASAGWI